MRLGGASNCIRISQRNAAVYAAVLFLSRESAAKRRADIERVIVAARLKRGARAFRNLAAGERHVRAPEADEAVPGRRRSRQCPAPSRIELEQGGWHRASSTNLGFSGGWVRGLVATDISQPVPASLVT